MSFLVRLKQYLLLRTVTSAKRKHFRQGRKTRSRPHRYQFWKILMENFTFYYQVHKEIIMIAWCVQTEKLRAEGRQLKLKTNSNTFASSSKMSYTHRIRFQIMTVQIQSSDSSTNVPRIFITSNYPLLKVCTLLSTL